MRPHPAVRCGLSVLAVAVLAACSAATPATPPATTQVSVPPDADDTARADLAARAALAVDRGFVALYTLTTPGRDPRSVVATVAADGTWRVDIPGGALGGAADVAVVQTAEGVYQCALPSATSLVYAACVRVADRGGRVPRDYDPKVQRVFRQWLSAFQDRRSALSVTAAQPLPGAQGSCFSIDSISASLNAPVDIGIYCYAPDGLLTAARVGYGTLALASAPAPAPPSVTLPGPVVAGPALGMDAPPPLPESPSSAPPA